MVAWVQSSGWVHLGGLVQYFTQWKTNELHHPTIYRNPLQNEDHSPGTTHRDDKTVIRPYYLYDGIPILVCWNISYQKLATEYTTASSVNMLLDIW